MRGSDVLGDCHNAFNFSLASIVGSWSSDPCAYRGLTPFFLLEFDSLCDADALLGWVELRWVYFRWIRFRWVDFGLVLVRWVDLG